MNSEQALGKRLLHETDERDESLFGIRNEDIEYNSNEMNCIQLEIKIPLKSMGSKRLHVEVFHVAEMS